MAEKKTKQPVQPKKLTQKFIMESNAGVYEGYQISWLRQHPEHPDYHLVEEFDKLPKGEK